MKQAKQARAARCELTRVISSTILGDTPKNKSTLNRKKRQRARFRAHLRQLECHVRATPINAADEGEKGGGWSSGVRVAAGKVPGRKSCRRSMGGGAAARRSPGGPGTRWRRKARRSTGRASRPASAPAAVPASSSSPPDTAHSTVHSRRSATGRRSPRGAPPAAWPIGSNGGGSRLLALGALCRVAPSFLTLPLGSGGARTSSRFSRGARALPAAGARMRCPPRTRTGGAGEEEAAVSA
ncbi:hypothetical protein HPB50_023256 [Hyalomma asiaticum]|uniref:Uncharacterized protein n=1 Tax=Hyalomma asiaticum TaxID=266040 RepID=A0ACB7S9G3_HYAAI|nr:hypothetical protein HPB50_023256 [Hyalomma asiaticum]